MDDGDGNSKKEPIGFARIEAILLLKQEEKNDMNSFILNDEIITKYEKILKRPSFDQEEQQTSQSLQVLNTAGILKDEI